MNSSKHNIVDNTSIQSQFIHLSRERDQLRHDCAVADRELRRETEKVEKLRIQQARLADEIRVAHAAVGEVSKKRHMLSNDIQVLKSKMEEDRVKILQLVAQGKRLEHEDKNR